ncbi:MAG: glycerophosphodiester phosphodiesterase family protein [Halioglobus sp.]
MATKASLRDKLFDVTMATVDAAMAIWPRPLPSREALERCRIIAHRGEHDNRNVFENTLHSFQLALDAGVWGIECDIRFTRDRVPVICHDPTANRVFGTPVEIAQTTFADLRAALPQIPSLEELVAQFGGRAHLMLELKNEEWPEPQRQCDSLREALAPLEPVRDFHLLSLHPPLYERVDFAPASCFVPVAETNVDTISRFALERGCAGLGGHYLLSGKTVKRRHDGAGQQLGTGFPTSGNCLRRELNRGVEWIFTNHAVKLETLRRHYLASHTR